MAVNVFIWCCKPDSELNVEDERLKYGTSHHKFISTKKINAKPKKRNANLNEFSFFATINVYMKGKNHTKGINAGEPNA